MAGEERTRPQVGKCEALRLFILGRYASVITKYPSIILLLTIGCVTLAALNGFIKELGAKPFPDFSLPSKGFEPRGTLISRRIVAYNNLEKMVLGIPLLATSSRRPDLSSYNFDYVNNPVCSLDPRSYLPAKTVYGSNNEMSLFNSKSLKIICQLEEEMIRSNEDFERHCKRATNSSTECCPSISIGTFVARYNNKTNCRQINDADVGRFLNLLKMCKKYVDDGRLSEKCSYDRRLCRTVPLSCLSGNIVLSVFQYMVDKDFSSNVGKTNKLTYTIVFSPLPAPPKKLLRRIYDTKLDKIEKINREGVEVVAYEFTGMKNMIYDKQLLLDIWYVLSAMILVVLLMWMYSGSLLLSLMGFTTVIFALVLSYWIYSVIFQLHFFPFLNIMTAIFIVGIGADDVFVYVLAWRHARQKIPKSQLEFRASLETVTCWTEYALEHAAAAMFVTSFTTATAFYAGVSSDITALQCFSIFAGTSIMTNYLLMLTWFPAIMVMHQKYLSPICCSNPTAANQLPGVIPSQTNKNGVDTFRDKIIALREKLKGMSDMIFGHWIAFLVVKLRYVWVFVCVLLATLGVLCMTVYPKLQLPTSQMFPLFIHRHPLEQYDFKIREKLQIDVSLGSERADFPLIFVWGVHDKDRGYFLDPDNTGSSVWDSSFDIMNETSQIWVLNFCREIRNQSFFKSGHCFMEQFHAFAEQKCVLNSQRKCCGLTTPLSRPDFRTCAREYVAASSKSHRGTAIKIDGNGNVRLMLLRFRSNYKYQFKFSPVNSFWTTVKQWSDRKMAKAPTGMRNGWVISDLYFYDLQQSLADGTIKTIGISIGISAMVLFVTTQNVIVTLFAVLAISGIIAVTVGTLVLSGWKLNILESMTMSVAVGLSIDFTLHYGVAYFLCRDSKDRKDRVHYSLWHVGSAVAMGTVTTFLAGLVMMPSVIYAYIQIGHFLMLVMSTSWFYATFFFLSLTALLGPQGHFGHVIKCWRSGKVNTAENTDKKEDENIQGNVEFSEYEKPYTNGHQKFVRVGFNKSMSVESQATKHQNGVVIVAENCSKGTNQTTELVLATEALQHSQIHTSNSDLLADEEGLEEIDLSKYPKVKMSLTSNSAFEGDNDNSADKNAVCNDHCISPRTSLVALSAENCTVENLGHGSGVVHEPGGVSVKNSRTSLTVTESVFNADEVPTKCRQAIDPPSVET